MNPKVNKRKLKQNPVSYGFFRLFHFVYSLIYPISPEVFLFFGFVLLIGLGVIVLGAGVGGRGY